MYFQFYEDLFGWTIVGMSVCTNILLNFPYDYFLRAHSAVLNVPSYKSTGLGLDSGLGIEVGVQFTQLPLSHVDKWEPEETWGRSTVVT